MPNNSPFPNVTALFGSARPASPARMSPDEAVQRLAAGTAVLVDCRECDEWEETGILAGAVPLALSDLQGSRSAWTDFLSANKDKQILLYCLSGARSASGARQLAAQGFNSGNTGGLHDWFSAGHKLTPYAV